MSKKLNICEIFGPTIQGEGALIGRPTIFVRTGGCDYRCSWCDTMYAVDPANAKDWIKMTAQDIMDEIERLSSQTPMSITLSGGNPALQPFDELIDLGHAKGYDFSMETQGSISKSWFSKIDYLTLSPKPPSSLMQTDWQALEHSIDLTGSETDVSLKVVIFDDMDFDYAKEIKSRFPNIALYLQAGNHQVDEHKEADIEGVMSRFRWLAERVAQEKWENTRVLPQLHVLTWGNMRAA